MYSIQVGIKESCDSNTQTKQTKTITVTRYKKGTLYNDERIDPTKSTIVQIYALNIGASKYIKQILTSKKGEIDSNTILVGDFNIPLTSMNASSRLKTNNKMLVLNDALKQTNFLSLSLSLCVCNWGETEIEKIFHSKTAEYTFFSSAHGIFSRIDHILHHKINLGKPKLKSCQASFLTTIL